MYITAFLNNKKKFLLKLNFVAYFFFIKMGDKCNFSMCI